MKKFYLLLLLSSFALYSCGKKEEKVVETPKKTEDTSSKTPETKTETAPGANNENTGKIEVLKFDKKEVPSDMKFKGKITGGAKWKDDNGENVLIITETEIQNGKSKDGNDAISKELFAYNYVIKNGETSLLWQINDFIKDCEFDLFLNYYLNTLTITDLNANGIGESTFLYRLSCRSDVSPDEMKLMMHEGKDKYALRGENEIKFTTDGQTVTQGGDYKPDAAFNNAPAKFLDYAKSQWAKYKTQELN